MCLFSENFITYVNVITDFQGFLSKCLLKGGFFLIVSVLIYSDFFCTISGQKYVGM